MCPRSARAVPWVRSCQSIKMPSTVEVRTREWVGTREFLMTHLLTCRSGNRSVICGPTLALPMFAVQVALLIYE